MPALPDRPFLGSREGVSRGRLRAQRFQRLSRDVYVVRGTDLDVRTRAAAALLALPDAVVCGRTAALLSGLPVDDDGVVHLARRPGAPRSERPGVQVHRLAVADDERATAGGVPCTSVARTFMDLAAVLDLEGLVAVGDAALRRCGRPALEAAVGRRARRPGLRLARRVLPLLDAGSDSPAESRARLRLHAAGLTALRHGLVVRDELGGWLARPDLADPLARVAVQHDGWVHLVGLPERRRHDLHRDELVRQEGWQVVVSTAVDDREPALLVAKVAAAYRRQARLLGPQVLPDVLRVGIRTT